ncbi:MAG TPA: aminoglycoside phosphotransferase family protein [Pyrinomonadaceae bacterium]|nr:aminoglycoside phosphotransferase family protein [Pyrinomonadaceae bacterium]
MSKETETILKIISDEFAELPLKISPLIDKGFVNKVFLVETEIFKFIFRTNDLNSFDEYEKERWAANRAIRKNIPTPQILKTGIYENQAFSIQKYVEGIEGRDFSGDKKIIWKKLGEYAKQIHTIKIGGFGLKLRDMTEGGSKSSWLKYLDYNIESLTDDDELLKLGVLTRKKSKIIRNIFENLKLSSFEFGLNHGDLSLKNTIVDNAGMIHLLDWGSAEASIVPHHDLIQLLKVNMQENDPDDSEIKAFLEGYGILRDEYEKMLPDLKSLSILRAFDKLRWAIDWKIPALKDYVSQAKETVEKYL